MTWLRASIRTALIIAATACLAHAKPGPSEARFEQLCIDELRQAPVLFADSNQFTPDQLIARTCRLRTSLYAKARTDDQERTAQCRLCEMLPSAENCAIARHLACPKTELSRSTACRECLMTGFRDHCAKAAGLRCWELGFIAEACRDCPQCGLDERVCGTSRNQAK